MKFKIIALRALEFCDPDYVKNLEKFKLYYFYQDYRVENQSDGSQLIEYKPTVPSKLYDLKRIGKDDLNVNISAIVGKNGSGKSSVVELLFRIMNNVACKVRNKSEGITTITAQLKNIKGIHAEFYMHTDAYYKVWVNYKDVRIYKFEGNRLDMSAEPQLLELDSLFYTEVINYSHYAYNTKEYGDWLKELFHKNDSYQTPLVLNPMRREGDIQINTENNLAKQRLMSNLLVSAKNDNHFLIFGDNLIASKLKFKWKENKKEVIWYRSKNIYRVEEQIIKIHTFREKKEQIIKDVMKFLGDVEDFDYRKLEWESYTTLSKYIVYKLISMAGKYVEYGIYKELFTIGYNEEFDFSLFEKYLSQLKIDDSHIVFKLNQTINYIKCRYNKTKFITLDSYNSCLVSELAEEIFEIQIDRSQNIMNLLPPPIFEIEIILTPLKSKNDITNEVAFNKLSSGEKQLAYSVSSLLYHLRNLDSVSINKIQYKCINIILEEIELYFHPELQRNYIKYILDSIERLQLQNIQALNFCFVTHSPFILSDIPSANIMFMKVENGIAEQVLKKKNTFGANIHEILGDSFFMDKGYIGTFSQNKIEETIKWINDNKKEKEELKLFLNNKLFHQQIISLIDEPILKTKLGEMLTEIDNDQEFQKKLLDQQIELLTKKRNSLNLN